jgi:hypothetical protein
MQSSFLLHGLDTIQCAYYLRPTMYGEHIDFMSLAVEKETLQKAKTKEPKPITLAGMEFLLHPYGSSSGYPFIISNQFFKIEFGEFNSPSFFVTYPSQALWAHGADVLHNKFMEWSRTAGFESFKPEALSRVDYSFDYHLPEIDFDEDSFVSQASKDSQFRQDGKVQTFTLGRGDIVLRVYNKIAEIEQQSAKVWFFELWGGVVEDVWRIEWQVRKSVLRRFHISTFDSLFCRVGDLLRFLATEHTTLRIKGTDSNRSRWCMHPLWDDLLQQIENLDSLGTIKGDPEPIYLEERMMRSVISVYGYAKRIAAVRCLQKKQPSMSKDEAVAVLAEFLSHVHDPRTWDADVEKRMAEMRLGKW